MLTLGIDDAGRGPLIGPMVLAGILLKKRDADLLKKAGVKDSKLLTQKKRLELQGKILKKAIAHKVILIHPPEIDKSIASGVNLNTLDAIKIAEIINHINADDIREQQIEIIVDCPSPNIKAWGQVLLSHIKSRENIVLKCEHKADFNHPVVSAASVLAKLAREEAVTAIKKEFGEMGSGYLTDPITQKFLKEKSLELENAGIFRKSWITWKNHLAEKEQKKLDKYESNI